MSGKPTLPPDVDKRMNVQGAAEAPPGLWNALDQERAASMADEGGTSGAHMEAQEPLYPQLARAWYRSPYFIGGCIAAGALGGLLIALKLRR